ncbi:MAG: serine/threonine-protein kinase, partial [Candidatus Hadarchaeum sp.]
MTEWIGRTVSKVEIQKLLGRGGMAEVYLGRHTTLNRPVAVKVLMSHLSQDDNLLNRFTAEAQAVAALRHPNIVQVFDFDVIDDRPYIVMELLDGPSLKDYLRDLRKAGGRLPERTIARLIASLASALDYAHARRIVHRDIKPANVILRAESGPIDSSKPLSSDVEPVLTDFGVARIADTGTQTASGVIIGTPAYMSPEQASGRPTDHRSDIYSLGVMLYEMLSGKLPFEGDSQASILIKHITEPPPPLPTAIASPEVQAVIERALAKNPDDRYQKAGDLAMVLYASLGLDDETGITEPSMMVNLEAAKPADADATYPLGIG